MDISSAPLLADINVDGKPSKPSRMPTKQGFLYVFDRVTGKPVGPSKKSPVEKGNVPGEWYSPTQPFPTKPPAYARNGVTVDDLIDFTPALRDQALTDDRQKLQDRARSSRRRSKASSTDRLATLTLGTASGGTNWPGGSYDPETHTVYAYACNACVTPIGLVESPKEISDMDYVAGTAGQEVRMRAVPAKTPAPILHALHANRLRPPLRPAAAAGPNSAVG